MKKIITSIFMLAVSICLFQTTSLFSQNKVQPPALQNTYSLSPTGDATNPMPTTVQPAPKEVSAHEKDLIQRLEQARQNNNTAEKQQIEAELNQIHGGVTVTAPFANDPVSQSICTFSDRINPPFTPDFNNVPVNTGSDPWAVSTCTNPVGFPNAGRIWCVYSAYAGTVDTLKIAYSDNGGASWSSYAAVSSFAAGLHFRSSELKVIPVNESGTMFLFVAAGYDFGGNSYSGIFRWNVTATAYTAATLLFPGQNFTYNPRICTDNSNYLTGNEYVYVIASKDSVTTGGNSKLSQNFAVLLTPGSATLTYTYRNPSPGTGFYWNGIYPTGTYLSSDIGYYQDAGVNRVMTVFNTNYTTISPSLYLAWSDSYGSTNTGSIVLTSTLPTRGARIAFNGGTNKTGMITYYHLFNASGNDWDFLSYNTTTGGLTTGAWTAGTIEGSSNITSGHPDVIAEWGAVNIFKAAFTENSGGPKGFYSGFNGTAWSAPSALDATGLGVDTTYTGINPGYKNGGGDDNIAFYSKVGGTGDIGIYCSNNIASTVGIHNINNGVPSAYSLSQNYPNPFNPTTNIKFSIPRNSAVKIAIYDLTGSLVATLVDGQLNAGNYSYNFDASNIASGVYFYKLQSDGFTDVKKMMLVK